MRPPNQSLSRALRFASILSVMLALALPLAHQAEAAGSPGPGPFTASERVGFQRAIEEVYWRHRVWPEPNPGPKPALGEVLPESVLRERAEDGPRLSTALRSLWSVPVDGPQLAREIQRMVASTRSPAVLDELFEALGRDPLVIAECLGRPRLAERLARQRYAFDPRFHARVAERARAAHLTIHTPADLKARSEAFREVVWRRATPGDAGAPAFPTAVRETILTPEEWDERIGRLAAALGVTTSTATLPVGRITPIMEEEDAFRAMVVVESRDGYLRLGTGEWRKEPFRSWWARVRDSYEPAGVADVGALAVPRLPRTVCTNDTWTPIERRLPGPRSGHTAVWTGTEMIVWGGGTADGERYDPVTDIWTALPAAGAPGSDTGNAAVWTGQEMVIWGGSGEATNFDPGARYNPSLDTWTPVTTLLDHSPGLITATWTGSRMLVFGVAGSVGGDYVENYGWSYDPVANTWQPIALVGAPLAPVEYTALWANGALLVWGGTSGGRYNPATDTWQAISIDGAPATTNKHTAVWTGSEMLVWGAGNSNAPVGARYSPATDSWAPMSTLGAPSGFHGHAAVWTGQEMIVWGGYPPHLTSYGARYSPATNLWSPMTASGEPTWRKDLSAVWTGSEVVVFGGEQSGIALRSGGRYDPVLDTWAPTAATFSPPFGDGSETTWTGAEVIVAGRVPGRYDPASDTWGMLSPLGSFPDYQPAIWTGQEVIAWGGQTLTRGARYNPTADRWRDTSAIGAPVGRSDNGAVWTGTEMIVWGGSAYDYYVVLNDGGRYDPSSDTWKLIPVTGAPNGRACHARVWTGSHMIVWGGYSQIVPNVMFDKTGGMYEPATGTWSELTTEGAPSARVPLGSAWTGHEFLVWGGYSFYGYGSDGGLFDPVTGTWTPTSMAEAPAPTHNPATDWTGTELLVWGGDAASSGRLDVSLNTWAPMSVAGAPHPWSRASHAFTGTQLFVWGAYNRIDGGLYCAPPPPRIDTRPPAVEFGPVVTGQAASAPVSITNRGGEDLVLGGLSSPAVPFALTSDPCSGQTLPSGVSCTVMATFAPASTGTFSSAVDIASNDTGTPVLTVGLTGQGVTTRLDPVHISLADADASGIAEPGETVGLVPAWQNIGVAPAFAVTGVLTTTGDATIQDATATYGTIAAGVTASCGTDCYGLQIPASRPTPHWDLSLQETLSSGETHTWTLHVGDSFADVPRTHWAYNFIETIYHHRVTSGCSAQPRLYCPASTLTRAEMAVLLLVAEHGPNYAPPASTGTVFADVPVDHWAGEFIERLAAEGITSGCGGGLYCPASPITRAEMAVFLLRAEHGPGYVPPAPTGTVFADVPAGHWAGAFIERLAAEGITHGCGNGLFCPNGIVSRAEMAVFLSATFGLVLNH